MDRVQGHGGHLHETRRRWQCDEVAGHDGRQTHEREPCNCVGGSFVKNIETGCVDFRFLASTPFRQIGNVATPLPEMSRADASSVDDGRSHTVCTGPWRGLLTMVSRTPH